MIILRMLSTWWPGCGRSTPGKVDARSDRAWPPQQIVVTHGKYHNNKEADESFLLNNLSLRDHLINEDLLLSEDC